MKLRTLLRIGFGTLLALLTLDVGAGMVLASRVADDVRVLAHRSDPLAAANARALQMLTDAQTGVRGYALTGNARFLEPYESGRAGFAHAAAELRSLAAGDPSLAAVVDEEVALGRKWLDGHAAPAVVARRESGAAPSPKQFEADKAVFDTFRRLNGEVGAAVREQQLAHRNAAVATTRNHRSTLLWTAAVGVGVAMVVLHLATRRISRPLERLREGVADLTAGNRSAAFIPAGPAEVRAVAESVQALAAELRRLEAIQAERDERARVIRAAASHIRAELDLATVLERAATAMGAALGADRATVRLVTDGGMQEVLHQWCGPGIEAIEPGHVPPPQAVSVLPANEPRGFDDIATDPGLDEAARTWWLEHGVRAALAVPVRSSGSLLAVLTLHHLDGPRHWSGHDHAVAAAVAREVAVAISHAKDYEHERVLVAKLQELDRAKSDFVSSVSHELRTPLTSIVGYIEMLLDGDGGHLSDPQTSMMSVVDRNARRLLSLIEDLLTLSKIESHSFEIDRAPVEVESLLAGALDAVAPLAAGGGIELTADVDARTRLIGDGPQLERVLLNLLSNAIKFTPEGGQVTVHARERSGELVIAVSDTGIGIPLEEQPRLFTKFYRSSLASSAAIQGTGLGLVIVQTIVDQHGGTVSLESAPGEGTTMTIRLPLPDARALALALAPAASSA